MPDGTYDVRVVPAPARPTRGPASSSTTRHPTANLTVPAGQLSGTVTLNGSGADGTSGVASVKIQYGQNGTWTDCGTGTSSSYSCNLDTTKLADGNYDFRVVVTDGAGNTTTNGPVTRTIVNNVPTVSITAPGSGVSLDGTVTVAGTAQSANGIQSLALEYQAAPNGAWQTICTPPASGTSYPYSCSWNTSSVVNGSYNLRATVTPTYGAAVNTTVTRTVEHPYGSVSITAPAAGATVKGSVPISGPVASSGTINKVMVTATPTGTTGGTAITACSVNAPFAGGTFSCGWNTGSGGSQILYGTYALVATMTDSNGTRTSGTVNVTVDNIAATLVLGDLPANLKGASTTLTATATTNATITGVRFEVTSSSGATTLCTAPRPASGSVWSCPWNIGGITYGAYSVQAVMAQSPGSEIRSDVKTTVVDQRVLKGASVSIGTGGTPEVLDAGDKVIMVYTGLVKLSSVQASLTKNGSVPVSVSLTRTANSGRLGASAAVSTWAPWGSAPRRRT